MKICGACQTSNPDDANLCVGCSAPLTELAAEAEVQRMMQAQAARKKRNRLLGIAGAVGVIVLVVVALQASARKKAEAEKVEAFYLAFQASYSSTVPEFWKCMTRSGVVPQNNLQVAEGIQAAFAKGPKGYVRQARDKCLPLALAAPQKLRAIEAPGSVGVAIETYATALEGVAKAATDYVGQLEGMVDQAELDAKVFALANNYHYAESDGPETYAYDHFLRCAIPGLDDMPDMQAIAEYLFRALKEPEPHVARWRRECSPALKDTTNVKPHANYQKNNVKLSADDRDARAFPDIFKKADEAARTKLTEPIERAWVESAQTWESLKGAIKDVIGEANG